MWPKCFDFCILNTKVYLQIGFLYKVGPKCGRKCFDFCILNTKVYLQIGFLYNVGPKCGLSVLIFAF